MFIENRVLDPKNDIVFKKIFGTVEHQDILIHFLNDILELKGKKRVKDVKFLPTSQNPDIASQKQSSVDVLCRDESGVRYIVEMQVMHGKGFVKRAQFYAAKVYCNQLNRGDEYDDLKEIIFLAITDFIMFPEKRAFLSQHVTLDKETHEHDLKDFYYSFLELPKFKKTIDQLDTMIDKWAYYFKHAAYLEPSQLKKLTSGNHIFQEAYDALNRCCWTDAELYQYERETINVLDTKAILAAQWEKGHLEGRAEALLESARKTALALIKRGLPMQEIREITGLTEEEIVGLMQQSTTKSELTRKIDKLKSTASKETTDTSL